MLSVEAAFERLGAAIEPLGSETAALLGAAGRILREDVVALRTQPPAAVSAMDGYAVRSDDMRSAGATLRVIGRVAAGDPPPPPLGPGEAARIFTGALMPAGSDAVALQEDAEEADGSVRLSVSAAAGAWVRPAGGDFTAGETLLRSPRRLTAEDVALAAAGGRAWLDVGRRPRVALAALGDELRRPGEPTPPGAITSSNPFGVAALVTAAGGVPEVLPILPDDLERVRAGLAGAASSDVIVTLGGASEGDHDLARPALEALGGTLGFYKIALRPGKPLTLGRLGRSLVLGLPGNPVSSLVCARLFLVPALLALQGAPFAPPPRRRAPLADDLPEKNGPRTHFMRARFVDGPDAPGVRPDPRQDSALLTVLSSADVLAVRPPHDPPRRAGESIEIIDLRADTGW